MCRSKQGPEWGIWGSEEGKWGDQKFWGKVIPSGRKEESRGAGVRRGGCGKTRTARVSRVGGRPQDSWNSGGRLDQEAGL